jgi:predicted dehydrogenase
MINWGIIGCGDVTEIKSGPAFNKIEKSRLVAVMRRNAAKAADYATRHQVPKWYNNAASLIADPSVNAIYVATPPAFHEAYVIQALRQGKDVYVEKPMATSAASCRRIIAAIGEHSGRLCVAHYRRALPMFQSIRQAAIEGRIGRVKMVRLCLLQSHRSVLISNTEDNWRVKPEISGGGLFFDLAPHQLDILIWMLGEAGNASCIALNQSAYYAAEDMVCGTMTLNDNIAFSGTWCFTVPEGLQEDTCEIIGDKGVIRFAVFGRAYQLNTEGVVNTFTFNHPQHIQQPMIEKVVQYFLGEGANPCSAEEALKSLKVMEAFLGR